MTNQNDIPEILGAEFTRARERAGLSTIDLAKMASLTTSHVEQIENGESSSFYSPAIKFVAAKKLASFLGLPETECFVYPEGVVTKSTKIQAAVGEADLTNKVHVSIAKENFDKLLLATQELDNKKSKFYKKPSFYFLAILLLAGVFVAIGICVSSFTNNTVVAFIGAAFICYLLFAGFEAVSKLSFFVGKLG